MSVRHQQWILLLCAVLAVAHQSMRWGWYIDDATISFAFARNLASGEGLVAIPGGERVEGYSNPTWVLILAAFELIGLSGFTVGKPLAALIAVATLPLVHRIAQRAMPDRAQGFGPLIAPLVLALNAQFALWSTSALENSLFCFLLALGIDRVLAEEEDGGPPWSAMAFLALAWTRPEGLLYAAIGGAWFAISSLRSGRGIRPILVWVGAFWLPHAAMLGARLWYFAWPFPNTYYAKVGVQGSFPLDWNARGWNQVRDYASRLWQGYFLPLYGIGLVGLTGWRVRTGVVIMAVVAALLLVPGPQALQGWSRWPEMDVSATYLQARILCIWASVAVLPLLAIGARGGVARGMCGHLAACTVFFAVYANGDWMGGFRWMSLMAPTTAVLFAVGTTELAGWWSEDRSWGTEGWLTAIVLIALLIPPNVMQTRNHALHNHDETPFIVKRRGTYTQSVARKVFWEEPIVNLEMDQGAHMWWFNKYREIDMAGLIDVPMSRHRYDQRPFMQEYVFEENRPTFAHVHQGWAKISRFKTYDGWHRDYVELPAYPDPGQPDHHGVWARRDLFVQPSYPSAQQVQFAEGVSLRGFDVPATTWVAGKAGFLEVAISTTPRHDPFRLVAFLSDGTALHSWDIALGYDGLYPMTLWSDDVFVGRYAVTLPPDLPAGTYALGFVVIGPSGEVWPAGGWSGHLPTAGLTTSPAFARGEVRFEGMVTVVASSNEDGADAAAARTKYLAASGDCVAAEAQWIRTKRHRPLAGAWHREIGRTLHRDLATCWAEASTTADLPAAALARAHRWDRDAPALLERGRAVGDALWTQATDARDQGDHQAAYEAFRDLLSFQPWRSWARRYAEEARDVRLGVSGLQEHK